MITMRRSLLAVSPLVAFLLAGSSGCQRLDAEPSRENLEAMSRLAHPPTVDRRSAWKEIDRLLEEAKLQEASDRLVPLVAAARASGDDAELAKALVRQSQVTMALGGMETAVIKLKAEAWPKESVARAAVELYYAHVLLDYFSSYDWEIRERERVISDDTVDLKAWTADQIAGEAERSFLAAWDRRAGLAAVPVVDFPYLRKNDYPPGIRDSLRDAVTYLFVERMLGDTRYWSAAESNNVWQLDLTNLLADTPDVSPTGGVPGISGPSGPSDRRVHPLLRAASVLADLERWHRTRKEADAALEARLTRQRLLFAHRTSAADRQQLIASLRSRLDRERATPWWSEGMAELAGEIDPG
ncbi:MAG: hypothetical protein ABI639_05200, partial [Thermoanaerobaculia bacterium]